MNVVSPGIGTDDDGQGLMFKNVSRLYLTSSELTPADGLLKRQIGVLQNVKNVLPRDLFLLCGNRPHTTDRNTRQTCENRTGSCHRG